MAADGPKQLTKAELDGARKNASTVVAAYGAVLEQGAGLGFCCILIEPPFPKTVIRQSIELVLSASTDDTKRNNLEVADMRLNDFVPDEDYCMVQHQAGGLSQALKNFTIGDRNAMQLAKTVAAGVTQEGEVQLRLIEERVKRDNQTTLERHENSGVKPTDSQSGCVNSCQQTPCLRGNALVDGS